MVWFRDYRKKNKVLKADWSSKINTHARHTLFRRVIVVLGYIMDNIFQMMLIVLAIATESKGQLAKVDFPCFFTFVLLVFFTIFIVINYA